MIFHATTVEGAFLVEPERREDERGFFARTWCEEEARGRGLNPRVVQCNVSFNRRAGTLRGLHYQVAPDEEAKLVRCTRGAIHDVIVDLRPGSASFMRHFAVVLDANGRRALYVPEGVAHGFQTLEDETEVFYQMSAAYARGSSRGVRWDDPAFGLRWPTEVVVISEQDRGYPNFTPAVAAGAV